MKNRKRNIQLKILVTAEERKLIEHKCRQIKSGHICGKWRLTDISYTPTQRTFRL